MIKVSCKPVVTCMLAAGLYASLVSTNITLGYDGDIDYSAPYVTLDPETGKLITVDPKQQQAAGQQQTPQHDPNATVQQSTADASAGVAATPATASSDTAATSAPASSSGTNVIVAVAGILLIAGIVAIVRRKSSAAKTNS